MGSEMDDNCITVCAHFLSAQHLLNTVWLQRSPQSKVRTPRVENMQRQTYWVLTSPGRGSKGRGQASRMQKWAEQTVHFLRSHK